MKRHDIIRPLAAAAALGILAACGSSAKPAATTQAPTTTAAAVTTVAAATPTTTAATTAATTGATTAATTGATTAATTGATTAGTTAATTGATTAGTTAAASASVAVAKDPKFGDILVDSQGFSLYLYTPDTTSKPTCVGGCATAWPPAVATGTPSAGAGIDASKLTTTARVDGSKQLAYNGHPLYRFKGDAKAGDVTGQGEGGVWFLVTPAGAKVAG